MTTFNHGYGLLIGVGQSDYPPYSLKAPVNDVKEIYRILTDPNLCAYPEEQVDLVTDGEILPYRKNILGGLKKMAKNAAADSEATCIVYYSGHGWLDKSSGTYYLIPRDVGGFDPEDSYLPASDFIEALRGIKAKKLLVLMDCCHAAGTATSKSGGDAQLPQGLSKSAAPKDVLERLKMGEGRAVCASSSGDELSYINTQTQLSVFTEHLIEALRGGSNQVGDTQVTVGNLMVWLGKTVNETAGKLYGVSQNPKFDFTESDDFPVALLLGGKGLSSLNASGEGPEKEPVLGRKTYYAEVKGDKNVLVQGDNNLVAGSGSVVIGGNVSGDMRFNTKDDPKGDEETIKESLPGKPTTPSPPPPPHDETEA